MFAKRGGVREAENDPSKSTFALGLISDGERSGWHCFRHSLSTWINDATKDITTCQTMLRHANPDVAASYTHGDSGKTLDAQRHYIEQFLSNSPAKGVIQ